MRWCLLVLALHTSASWAQSCPDTGPCDEDNDGFSVDDGDCDDTDDTFFPGADEVCDDGLDQDCDNDPDDGCELDGAELLGGSACGSRGSWDGAVRTAVPARASSAMIWWAALALAQDALDYSIDPERFRPTDDISGTAVVQGSGTLGHLQVGVGIWGNYSEDQVILERDLARVYLGDEPEFGNRGDGVIDERSRLDLQLGFGLFDRFSLTVNLPFVAWQDGFELASAFDPTVSEDLLPSGLGDIRVTPKAVLLPLEESPVGIAVLAPIGIPTGAKTSWMGEGAVSANPMVVLELADAPTRDGQHWVRLTLNGGMLIRERADYDGLIFDEAVTYGGAIGISPGPYIEFGADVVGVWGGQLLAENPIELLPWMKFRPDRRVTVTLGAGTGLLAGIGAPDARVFLGGSFQPSFDPKVRDRDGDGIVDKYDLCPLRREDVDGVEDDDGCPEYDDDRDGIDDRVDQCPSVPEDMDDWQDEDGCPDYDNDDDLIEDADDDCPNDKETYNEFRDEDGCPDDRPITDTDRDGFIDTNDQCPLDPEDFDSFQDEDGCPDLDNDGDGIGDLRDLCSREPEDFDGIEDEDGCPEDETDQDGDGIDDSADLCPDEPENINGFEDDDGCPDTPPPQRVFIRAERIVIADKIHFALNEAVIEIESFSLIDEIAQLILDHPEIARVEIQGHTDSQGDDDYNLELSQRRADAVTVALVQRGVEAERMTAVGFGEAIPIADNGSSDGRADNRRVEFYIRTE